VIELSCDLGEREKPDEIAVEEQIWPLVDAANVACGGHAGSDASMEKASALARERGIVLGAHPSYPDRPNFGRASMNISDADLVAALVEQISRLQKIASRHGVALQRVKAHGALYNDAHVDRARAAAIVEAIKRVDPAMAVVASDTSQTAAVARSEGIEVVREAFADRRYMPDGSLVSRRDSDALLSVEEAAAQALRLSREKSVIARNGTAVPLQFETICIHADMAGSVERLKAIRSALGR
jgi:UPF0271 protein